MDERERHDKRRHHEIAWRRLFFGPRDFDTRHNRIAPTATEAIERARRGLPDGLSKDEQEILRLCRLYLKYPKLVSNVLDQVHRQAKGEADGQQGV